MLWASRRGPKQHREGGAGRLRTPYSLPATGFPRTAAFLHLQNPTDRKAVRHVAARSCQQNPHAAAHVSTLLDVVTALTNRKAVRCIAARGVEVRGGPTDIQGCASKTLTEQGAAAHMSKLLDVVTTHRLKGCQTRCCWEVSRLLKVPGISRDVPAKTLTEQGAAAHMSKLLDVVTTHRLKGCQTRCCWEVSRLLKVPGISRDVPTKTLTEQGAAAHMSKLLDVVATVTDRRARRVAAIAKSPAEGPQKWSGSCKALGGPIDFERLRV